MLDIHWIRRWVELSAVYIADNREWLLELDRLIGDGDHGENLDRGFRGAVKTINVATPQECLHSVGTALLSATGGASGVLYGTMYLRMAGQAGDQIDARMLVEMLRAGAAGIQSRGRAVEGEKTMVDVWAPAVRAASDALAGGADIRQILQAAADAAVSGSDATIDLIATKGRAAYLGAKSAGHRDPGAASSVLIIQAALDACDE